MKARTKFLKIYKMLPEKARRELIVNVYDKDCILPYSINVIYFEVKNKTKLGDKFLEGLGFEDD